jgi:hypothetical protein
MMEHDRKRREVWRVMPVSSVVLFMALAFCLFASIGALAQLGNPSSLRHFWPIPLITGTFAAAVTWSGVRRRNWWTIVLVVVFNAALVLTFYFKKESAPSPAIPGEIQRWLTTTSAFIVAMIACGWALALTLINREGQRFFRVQTEMRLAGEIHQTLVPTIDTRIGDYEFYGVSRPSGMVGGDLVDVLSGDGRWLAYVVDVSGHGVSSGVLMAMVKSAIHTALRFHPKADGLLEAVNWVLCSLKATNMFATCGLIAFSSEHGLRYALAGHLPILRLRGQTIETLGEGNLPLGIVPEGKFEATPCEVAKGDVLVVVTDGLTEVSDHDGEELGFRHISQALRDHGERPAKEIAEQILGSTNGRKAPSDDQSLLIVRRLA